MRRATNRDESSILRYEQKWVYWYYGTGEFVPINKVKEELEKHGYKITIVKDEQYGELMRIEKAYEKFSLRIHEGKEIYCDNYLSIIEYKWELGEILDQLGILYYITKQEDDYSRPVYRSYGSIC